MPKAAKTAEQLDLMAPASVPALDETSTPKLEDQEDRELMAEFGRSGCERSFRILHARYYDMLKGFFVNRLDDYDTADDLVQEVLVRLHKSRDRYDGTRAFKPWLMTIAHNLLKNAYRSKSRERVGALSNLDMETIYDEVASSTQDPEQATYERELHSFLMTAIAGLKMEHRDPFIKYQLQPMSHLEIADEMGLSVSEVGYRSRSAGKKIRERLESVM